MGADSQPQIQLQCYLAMLDYGLDIQEALEMPRYVSGRFALGEARDTLQMEARHPSQRFLGLEERGHILDHWTIGPIGTSGPAMPMASLSIRRRAYAWVAAIPAAMARQLAIRAFLPRFGLSGTFNSARGPVFDGCGGQDIALLIQGLEQAAVR